MQKRGTQLPVTESDSAAAYVNIWRARASLLDAERLRNLRALSERDAAKLFADLSQGHAPFPLRLDSGLVEQQRILTRLHRMPQ